MFRRLILRGGGTIERALSWFGGICIGIYAFISGYGMFRSLPKNRDGNQSIFRRLATVYISIIKRILKFMRKYWLVFCIFVPIGFAIGSIEDKGFLYLLKNFLTVNFDYNGNWWYVKQYVYMLLLLPVLDLFFDFVFVKQWRTLQAFAVLAASAAMFAGLFLVYAPMYKNSIYCIIIFTFGYLCSRFDLFSKIQKRISIGAKSYLLGWILLVAIFTVRTIVAKNAGHRASDIVLAPIFCFAVCLITRSDGKISHAFGWLGKYSVYMWLTHGFYCMYYFKEFITFTRVPILIYLQLAVVALLTSAVLLFLEKQLCTLFTWIIRKIQGTREYVR